jgi:multiple RNA-binding domain-containing protein 1
MDNKTRGFAFLEYGSRRDAEAAFAALEHVHLLGRHLVLQWATEADEEASRSEGLLAISKKGSKRKFTME